MAQNPHLYILLKKAFFSKKKGKLLLPYLYCVWSCNNGLKINNFKGLVANTMNIGTKFVELLLEIQCLFIVQIYFSGKKIQISVYLMGFRFVRVWNILKVWKKINGSIYWKTDVMVLLINWLILLKEWKLHN